jgi:ABC-type multidrug transport system fused ATPase/permease subunit
MNPADEQSDCQNTPVWWQRHRLTILRMLSMVLAAGVPVLFARVVTQAPCWGLFILVGLLAWPVWQYRTEYLLLRRRLMLSAVARPQSRIRAWLWRGHISKAVQVVVAMFLAWVLLALVSQLSPQHWMVFAADAIFLALIVAPISRRLSGAITARHLSTVARHWPVFLVNGVVLTGAIMALDFFLVGAADSRHMAWHQVAVQAFTTINDQAGCVLWGVSAGLLAAVEALSWHTSELIIPNLPDLAAKLIAWSFFLLRAATLGYFFTALLLGVSILLEKREARRQGHTRESTIARAFLLTIIVLALPFFYAAIKLSAIDPAVFEQGVAGAAGLIDPCKPNQAARERLITRLDKQVDGERLKAMHDVDTGVDAGLERLFSEVEKGVGSYLDWHFSVFGEYQRLAAVLTEDLAATMRDKLEEHLFAQNDFDSQLVRLDREVEHDSAERFAALAPQLNAELDRAPCDMGGFVLAPLTGLDRDTLRASAAATSGVGAGIVASKVLAKKTAAAAAGKLAAKKSFQAGAALTSKTLAKKGSSSLLSAGLGTALCAPSGPVAILCGVTAGLVTWLTVDKALIELDEALNREDMRADLLEALAGQKAALGKQLKQRHYARVDAMAARVNDAVQRSFIPYTDGMD